MRNKLQYLLALLAVGWTCGFSAAAQTNEATSYVVAAPIYNLTNRLSCAITNPADGSLMDAEGNYLIKPCRVQLAAKVSSEVVTNWTLTSIQTPVRPAPEPGANLVPLVYLASGYHESGVIVSNTIATIEWHDKQIPVVLESVQMGTTSRVTWK